MLGTHKGKVVLTLSPYNYPIGRVINGTVESPSPQTSEWNECMLVWYNSLPMSWTIKPTVIKHTGEKTILILCLIKCAGKSGMLILCLIKHACWYYVFSLYNIELIKMLKVISQTLESLLFLI